MRGRKGRRESARGVRERMREIGMSLQDEWVRFELRGTQIYWDAREVNWSGSRECAIDKDVKGKGSQK